LCYRGLVKATHGAGVVALAVLAAWALGACGPTTSGVAASDASTNDVAPAADADALEDAAVDTDGPTTDVAGDVATDDRPSADAGGDVPATADASGDVAAVDGAGDRPVTDTGADRPAGDANPESRPDGAADGLSDRPADAPVLHCATASCGPHGVCVEGADAGGSCVCDPGYHDPGDLSCKAGPLPDWFSDRPTACAAGGAVGLVVAAQISNSFAAAAVGDRVALTWNRNFSERDFGIFDTTGASVTTQVISPSGVSIAHEHDSSAIAVNGDHVLVAWQMDDRTSRSAVYSTAGATIRAPAPLSTPSATGFFPSATATSYGFAVGLTGVSALAVSRMDRDGALLDTAPISVTGGVRPANRAALVWSGSELGIAWRESIYAYMYEPGRMLFARLAAGGSLLTAPTDIAPPDPPEGSYSYPAIAATGATSYLIAYDYLFSKFGVGTDFAFDLRAWNGTAGNWNGAATVVGANNPANDATSWWYPTLLPTAAGVIVAREWPGTPDTPDDGTLLALSDAAGAPLGGATIVRPGNKHFRNPVLIQVGTQPWLVGTVYVTGSRWEIWMAPVTCTAR